LSADLSVTRLSEAQLPELAARLRAADLPAEDLCAAGRRFWGFDRSGETIGFGGLEIYGTAALLRSMVVVPACRGSGAGRAILARLLQLAAGAGARDAYVLTTTARGFFERAGFSAIAREAAPDAIRATEQAARLCPASAAILHREIGEMTVKIYHNPACGTSRNVLGLIRNSGIEPMVIEYLKTPASREQLVSLIARMGLKARDLLRRKGTPYDELGLGDAALTETDLLDAMMAHPILIERPIVVTPLGARLCRPSELVLDILPSAQLRAFRKEDGEIVVDETGRRVRPALPS
jgi:arsenate reductase